MQRTELLIRLAKGVADQDEFTGAGPDNLPLYQAYNLLNAWREQARIALGTKGGSDLTACSSPDDFINALVKAAQGCAESASELESAWQSKDAGRPWRIISRELERCVARIDKQYLRERKADGR